jgi:hypothetical protein
VARSTQPFDVSIVRAMRHLILLPLLLLVTGNTIAQTDRLTLTTTITDERYCGTDYTDMVIDLSLHLTFTNSSSRQLILYKGSGDVTYYVLVAADKQRILKKQYESTIQLRWSTRSVTLHEGAQPGDEFVVLSPGESFQADGSVSFPIDLKPGTDLFLKPGQHVIQVGVATWPTDEKQLNRLRKKWEHVGYLWDDDVRSEPMALVVETKPKLVQCK